MARRSKKQAETPVEAAEAAAPQSAPKLVDFDMWYANRKNKIPAEHRKEVLKADFRGRGLKDRASMQDFDEALGKYGVKLS
jgi:hypothetical protein